VNANVPAKVPITVTVNGCKSQAEVEPRLLLAHFLRETLGLTGTHLGCETSICGACTVLLKQPGSSTGFRAVKSCAMFAVQADGSEITTIEGLSCKGRLHPIQEAFREKYGAQCGYCTPGMILTATQLLDEVSKPSRVQISHALKGNLCRCTGYTHIIDAVEFAAEQLAKGKS